MSKESETKAKGALKVDATGVEVSGELRGIPAMVHSLRSPHGKIQHAMAEKIGNHLKAGGSLSELPQEEQYLALDALGDSLEKAANRAAVLKRALGADSSLAGLLEAPKSAEADETPTTPEKAVEEADEKVRFWDRFWADAETTSVEYMQELYARILAGKVKSPKSFSLRTLDVVRCLEASTAKLFKLAAPFIINKQLLPDIFSLKRGFYGSHVSELIDAGLVSSNPNTLRYDVVYQYKEWYLRVPSTKGLPGLPPMVYSLTGAGRQLLEMFEVETNVIHVLWICEAFSQYDDICSVSLSEDGEWQDWKEFFASVRAKIAERDAAQSKAP